MSLLQNLTTDESIANEKDSVGGGFAPMETAIYKSTISLAYLQKSAGGALSLVLHMMSEAGKEFRQTIWMTSGDAKGNKNFYIDKNNDKQYLPGFNLANSLCLLTVAKEISQMETEKKTVPLYNFDAKAEVPTSVDMIMDLLGKEVYSAVFKQTVDKNAKGDDGKYYPTGETRDENEIDKFFRITDKLTTQEVRAGATDAAFFDTWEQKFTGQTRNKAKGASGTAGTPGQSRPPMMSQGAMKAPAQSLFAQ